MSIKSKTTLLGTLLLGLLFFYSYGSFTNYKPKTLVPLKEVKGTKMDENKINLPYPENYKIIGTSNKNGDTQTTYQTNLSPEQIHTFYRNILISNGWEIDKTGKVDVFTTAEYKLDKKRVSVTTSVQTNEDQGNDQNTIVSLVTKD